MNGSPISSTARAGVGRPDQTSLTDAVAEHKPDEIYNLAAQSFVRTSPRPGSPVRTRLSA
jgi:GDP-D-mannose dehydratase